MEFKVTMGEMEEAVRALYKMKNSLKTLDSSLGKLQREIQQTRRETSQGNEYRVWRSS